MSLIRRDLFSVFLLFRPRFLFWSGIAALIPDQSMALTRAFLYRLAGCDIGRGVAIFGKLSFVGSGNIPGRFHVGRDTFIGHGVILGLDEEIYIGSNVSVGPYTTLYTATHSIGTGACRMDPAVKPRAVRVEDGVWIAMNCVVLPGVTIGKRSVISAGAIVKRDVPPNSLAEGNPAAVTKELRD